MVMAVAALVGLFASAYLFYVYVTGGPIACAIVSGCDVIRSSKWSTSFGLPRPFFGLLFYGVMFQLLVVRSALSIRRKELYLATLVLSVIGFIESIFLFLVQWLDVKAFCVWCLVSGAAATVIFLAALADRQTHIPEGPVSGKELRHYFWLLLGYVPLAVLLFWWLLRVAHE
jgi:uncharacterized membrane protein